MGILEKAKAAVAGDDPQAAFKEQDKARTRLAELGQLRAKLEREHAEATRPLGKLSLDESAEGRKKYDAALATVERIERDLRRNGDAQAETRAELQTIAQRIAEQTHAERIRTLTRLGKARQQKAEALQETLTAFRDQYQAFRNDTEKLVYAFPQVADDIGLELARLSDAIAVELYRLWPAGPGHRNAASALPGAHSGLGLDAPSNILALADVVRQQHDAALHQFKASVTPTIEPALTVVATTTAERAKQHRTDGEPKSPAGRTLHAAAIQAGIKDVSLPVIDHRKGARHD
jgi:hypothetical protein